jgi:integrase
MKTTSKGGRPATGSIKWRVNAKGEGRWYAQITLADGSRPFGPLDPKIAESDVEGARACARETSTRLRAFGVKIDRSRETVAHYADRWCKWREAKGMGCADGDRALLARHILPDLGNFDVRHVARDDLKRLVGKLDAKVARGVSDDGKPFSAKTAINAWGTVRAIFRDAQRAKDVKLCVREDNPADGVAGPDAAAKKAKTYLWPSEFLTVAQSDRVPLRWRRLFALAIYMYGRAGEITALHWPDVDLDHGTIHIHRSIDRVRKRQAGATKTDTARRIPIEPELLPLLRAMHAEAGGKGRVFNMPSVGILSRKLKVYLRRAGVTRSDLFESDATRKAITFHDLRATGITWMAARGDDPLRIMQRAGHADFETTKLYMREAENLSASFGSVFPALPEALLGSFATDTQKCETENANFAELLKNVVELTGIEPVTSCMPCKRSPN